jgi:hypothetical protein
LEVGSSSFVRTINLYPIIVYYRLTTFVKRLIMFERIARVSFFIEVDLEMLDSVIDYILADDASI